MELRQHENVGMGSALRTTAPADAKRFRAEGDWRDRTFLDDFLDNVAALPDKAAVVSYRKGEPLPTTITYGQLGALVDRFAGGLLAAGIGSGDVVAIQVANGWVGPALAFATMRVGAVPNPIPIIYREHELRFMLEHAGTKAYFVPQQFRGYDFATMARKLQSEIPTLEHLYFVDSEAGFDPEIDFVAQFVEPKRELDPGLGERLQSLRPTADDIAMLVYTSGTTGTPKGAVHTHNTAWSGYRNAITQALDLTASDVTFMASTLGHLTGFIHGMLVPLSMGQKVVYQDLWDVEGMLDMMDVEGLTWTLSSTTFALDMVEAQRKRAQTPASKLRAFACGGASIPPGVAVAMDELFSTSLVPLWGCSETGIASIHRIGASVATLDVSDGFPVTWQETRVVDTDGVPVPDGTVGDLQVRGPGVFVGYFGRPDLTEAAFTADGWYDTGDLGRVTGDGAIRIEGRSKDIIIRGGQNISPEEIEKALYTHPNVQDVAVVAYPDDRLGERVCAVIVAEGEAPTLEDVVAHVERAGMAKPFWPQKIVVVKDLPRTPSGKVQKFVLRERLAKAAVASPGRAG
ncbi:AMP-binding protein [Sciscionella marina]|uniref:AMP-binding protein n=1 Tax=Sciscionella marina TaxID=508770 RepID=UPI0003A014DE|nr:AMP-binding protein [Sciscionella marina]